MCTQFIRNSQSNEYIEQQQQHEPADLSNSLTVQQLQIQMQNKNSQLHLVMH